MSKNFKKNLLFFTVLAFFLFTVLYKLTAHSIWMDEAFEYWISRTMTGSISWYSNNGVTDSSNMYIRMLGAFQPPLYNFLLHFWLLINQSEFWLRFSSVLMSAIGIIGIYKCVNKVSNYKIATVSMVMYTCIYEVIYYTQECGEYAMLLMFLPWTIYFYLKLFIDQDKQKKNFILFVIMSILSIYTQYGTAFLVIPMLISIFIKAIIGKDKKNIITVIVTYIIALVTTGIPLIVFFVIPQIKNLDEVGSVGGWKQDFDNIFLDFFNMFLNIFRWNFIEETHRFYIIAAIAVIALSILAIITFIKSRSQLLRHLIIINFVTYILFYLCTRTGIYGRGYFGFRYNLFFIPLWVVSLFVMLIETGKLIKTIKIEKMQRILYIGFCLVVSCVMLGYCVYGTYQISKRWQRADNRGTVNAWYDLKGYEEVTLVNIDSTPAFSYYYENSSEYKKEYDQKIYRETDFYRDEESYLSYLNECFGEEYPAVIYYAVGDYANDYLPKILKDKGYTEQVVYYTTTGLYCYSR